MKITLKSSRLLLAFATLAVALLFTFAVTASAKDKNKNPTPATDTRILIQSIDPAGQTVVIQNMKDKSTHTYKIDGSTTITVNNNPGTFADIKAGMQVSASTERDSATLDAISVSMADPAPPPPSKGKGKKGSSDSSSSSS